MPPRIFGLEPPLTLCLWLCILYIRLANQVASGVREYHMIFKGVQGQKKFENPCTKLIIRAITFDVTQLTRPYGTSTLPTDGRLTTSITR